MLRHGRNAAIYVNGVDISGDLNTVTPNSEQELADVSTFGNLGHSFYPGLAKDSAAIEAVYNSTERLVFESMIQRTTSSCGMMIAYGQSLGDPAYAADDVKLKSNGIKSVVTDVNRASISIQTNNYPFEDCTLLSVGKESVIASGNEGSIDAGANTALGAIAYAQVFGVSSGTLALIVQQSSTGAFGGEEVTAITIPTVTTGFTPLTFRVSSASTTVYRYTRVKYTLAGAGASTCTFAVALKRY